MKCDGQRHSSMERCVAAEADERVMRAGVERSRVQRRVDGLRRRVAGVDVE